MKKILTIIIYQIFHLVPQKGCQTFPNFDLDPNWLLLIGVTTTKNSSNVSTLPDTQTLHDTTLISGHLSGIPVKPLLLNYSRHKDEFPSWRLNCAQILVFSRTRSLLQYYDELVNWGNRNNVVIYLTLTLTSLIVLMESKFLNFLSIMGTPIYVIVVQADENTGNHLIIYTTLLSLT